MHACVYAWGSIALTISPPAICTLLTHPPSPLFSTINSQLGGSGVLVQPMTYIFDEEPARWHALLSNLGLDETTARAQGMLAPAAHANGNGVH